MVFSNEDELLSFQRELEGPLQGGFALACAGAVVASLPPQITRMPWTCPACRMKVQHSEAMPQPDRVYRCPVCHLQMKFDPLQRKMKPIPPNGDNGAKTRNVA